MKKILLILSSIVLSTIIAAQAPQSLNYQAVVRDNSGNPIANQNVSFRISILQTSETGTAVYTETHNATTNDYGLVTLKIGEGTPTGDFSTIDWSADKYFVKIEIDPAGGTSYTAYGTSQLLSVPYALEANKLDGQNGNYYTNAGNISAGTLNNSRYSAYSDLSDEGRLDNNSGSDLLTRSQADARYIYPPNKSAFNAYISSNSTISSSGWTGDIIFDSESFDLGADYNSTTGIYTAPINGIYSFSAMVSFNSVDDGMRLIIGLYVDGTLTKYLVSTYVYTTGSFRTLNGSIIMKLTAGQKVSIRIYSADASYTIAGDDTHDTFCGALLYEE